MKSPRETMANAMTYQVFNAGRKEKIRLDLNENAWGCSPKVMEAIWTASVEDVSLYPEYEPFLNKLAGHYQVSAESILISNGADDSIRCIFDALVEADDEILLPIPNYGMFDIYGRIRGAKTTEVLYHEDFSFPTKEILKRSSDRIKLIVIVDPANPLGTSIPEIELIRILETAPDSYILLDETYFHFAEKSNLDLIRRFDNLIVVRTFSKAYGLTGLRLGVLFSDPVNIRELVKTHLPFAVNSLALKAAGAALEDQAFITDIVKKVRLESRFLADELAKMGIETRTCCTNFLLMHVGEQSDRIHQELQDNDILLRNLNHYPLLKGYLRISIGRHEDLIRFLDVLRRIMGKSDPINRVINDEQNEDELIQVRRDGIMNPVLNKPIRTADIHRKTNETDIAVQLNVDGRGEYRIQTPIGFLSHMLESFAKHGLFDLEMTATGDLQVDQHHLLEDCGIVLGSAFRKALGDKKGISRAGYFVYPMDEALAVVAVDIGGRSCLQFDAKFRRQFCGELDTDLIEDFFHAFAGNLGANIVVRMPFGRSDHHKIEAIFKAFAKSMNMACSTDPRAMGGIASTKGLIDHDSDR